MKVWTCPNKHGFPFLLCLSVHWFPRLESSCVLASPASPSSYHGDESRQRLSAVISCTLPTGFFLDSPLVIICVLSFHCLNTLSLSVSHCPFKPRTLYSTSSPSVVSSSWPSSALSYSPPCSPAVVSRPGWQICSSQKATTTRSHCGHSGWS